MEGLQALSPSQFERWVAGRFQERGYRVRRTGTHGTGGDHGIDLVVSKPGERAVVQCKNFRAWAVGEPAIRDLYGVMCAAGVDRAYLVTTGRVTGPAWRWAAGKPIQIIDGETILRALASAPRARVTEVPAGTETVVTPPPRSAPDACPRCGAALVERRNRSNGDHFWGCTSFPRCRFTRASTAAAPQMSGTRQPVGVVRANTRLSFD